MGGNTGDKRKGVKYISNIVIRLVNCYNTYNDGKEV